MTKSELIKYYEQASRRWRAYAVMCKDAGGDKAHKIQADEFAVIAVRMKSKKYKDGRDL